MRSTPAYLRKLNEWRVFESVMRLRGASRAQVSRVSGVSSPTVGRIVDDLLNEGILMEAESTSPKVVHRSIPFDGDAPIEGRATSAIGRPSTPLRLDNRRSRFLAVQLGVRQTRLARTPIALPDEDVWEVVFPTPSNSGEWVEQLARHAAALPVSDLRAVVVSVPGIVDEPGGRVLFSPNLRWTESADLRQMIDRAVAHGVSVIVVQEIRALALGHFATNAEAGDVMVIDFGSGVGGAALIGGRLYSGPLPISAEIGHTPVLGNWRQCGCGSVGCIETLVSRRGLLASAQEHDSSLKSWPDVVNYLTHHESPAWLKQSLDAAAVCIAASLNNFGLRRVAITGALSELPSDVIGYLRAAVLADTMWARFGTVEVLAAPRRRLAGMVHAAVSRTVFHSIAEA